LYPVPSIVRTCVTFRHPAAFVGVSDDDGILSVKGAGWFVALLRQVRDLEVRAELCQEDWGIVAFVERGGRKFWIGLSWDDEGAWIAHVHHGSWAWLQRFSPSGKRELRRLVQDFHQVLESDAAVSAIAWHREDDMMKPTSSSA
jgi:hypothetical protein